MSLVLFDIDGTLLLSGGAGLRAMNRAFEQVFAIADGFAGIEVAGQTDTYLLSRALTRAALPDTPETHRTFRDAYVQLLETEIAQPGTGRRGLMPGVADLLATLARRDTFHLGLLTGNYERAAQIKLREFGLAQYFEWGAFGEDAADRSDLARRAIDRARQCQVPDDACRRAIVIGDTPHDIACARAIGARVIAVATGSYVTEQLESANPDATLRDLSDTEAVLALLA